MVDCVKLTQGGVYANTKEPVSSHGWGLCNVTSHQPFKRNKQGKRNHSDSVRAYTEEIVSERTPEMHAFKAAANRALEY